MDLENKLDLTDFLDRLRSLFARKKPLAMEGDSTIHREMIGELMGHSFKAPPPVEDLSTQLRHLQKEGVLTLQEIFQFVKIVNYLLYLQSLQLPGAIGHWLASLQVPQELEEILGSFDEKGELRSEIDERLVGLERGLSQVREEIGQKMQAIINLPKMGGYLVDRQIHYINGEEALLLRGGFNHLLKGSIIGRSSGGFFYVVPESLEKLKRREAELLSRIEEIRYEIAKDMSRKLQRWQRFLEFANRTFDRFDHYQARVRFAKEWDLIFVDTTEKREIYLENFIHPAIDNPKPVTIDFSKKILLITGVNAGGKTMLLKSILAAAYMAKYLIPMRCSPKSRIGRFKEIIPIIEDPQNVKNDISTFAGRMLEFSRLFQKSGALVGVDEIELGTDSDEAATLFKVVLEELSKREIKIAITTHHKRLAALMASHDEVELVAAMYDEERGVPTYQFLQGIIGKSYAFETAKRYGIPGNIVQRAVREYGEDQAKLSELIERGSQLEKELKEKREVLERELQEVQRARTLLEEERHSFHEKLKEEKAKLHAIYSEAIEEAKRAIKAKEERQIHRHLTKAAHKVKEAKLQSKEPEPIQVGDSVKYRKTRAKVLSIKGREATIEAEGLRLRVPLSELKRVGEIKMKPKRGRVSVAPPKSLSVKLDLHGLRVDEALEKTDRFLSDALLAGFDEVLIYHGIGTGRLARAVREFLKDHPRVRAFHDAPPNMGGFGATVVEL
ncbi:MAG: endonuclease MutS2 [Epsilonproteobacteria bacterium]|nr:endonuclease MutS2 [Campylobacterota bacterium]NPA57061.1 endonuclease MutS2 [Campylobacterota bacterium]